LNELTQLLPAGRYQFTINSRATWTIPMLSALPHCTEYGLRVSIQNAYEISFSVFSNFFSSDEAEHVDCADYNVLPWDLNSSAGGSKPYGGPIDT
jgi:hypothetical protein